ncbi:hypothetical protein GCM10023340_28000 [Nocardioides marinquilinus]|uniref:Polyketide cyclase n=1 Tax=Nocardioides marinquilinus TaxID=1210400 RepID=A0ABP9PSB7_9ACTN
MIGDRWGVTDAEVARHYACDDVVPDPALQAWRGVTVAVPPEQVWPWVGQVRVAPYSYDWVDNLGRRSPATLQGLPEPVPGEPFTRCAGRPFGEIVSVTPGERLTGRILGAVMSYELVLDATDFAADADADGQPGTRLLLKVVMARHRWLAPAVAVGDLVMARRQLLNLARLAERHPA